MVERQGGSRQQANKEDTGFRADDGQKFDMPQTYLTPSWSAQFASHFQNASRPDMASECASHCRKMREEEEVVGPIMERVERVPVKLHCDNKSGEKYFFLTMFTPFSQTGGTWSHPPACLMHSFTLHW